METRSVGARAVLTNFKIEAWCPKVSEIRLDNLWVERSTGFEPWHGFLCSWGKKPARNINGCQQTDGQIWKNLGWQYSQ